MEVNKRLAEETSSEDTFYFNPLNETLKNHISLSFQYCCIGKLIMSANPLCNSGAMAKVSRRTTVNHFELSVFK